MASTEFLAGSGSSSLFVVLVICSFLRILDRFTQEGAFTSAVGLAALCFVPASPRNLRFLNEEERDAYCRDLADDWSGDADTDGKYAELFSWNEVASVFTDAPHVLLMAIPMFLIGITVTFLFYSAFSDANIDEILSDSFPDLHICTCFLLVVNWAHGLTVYCSTPTIVSALGYSPSRTQLLTVHSLQLPNGRVVFTRHS